MSKELELAPPARRLVETLERARALIEKEGWAQDEELAVRGHCVYTALVSTGRGCVAAVTALHEAIGGWTGIVEWNDTPGRTKEEVLAAFDRAIVAAISRGRGDRCAGGAE